jgi:hypothetical protein
MIAELERRAAETEGHTAIDVVAEWTAEGGTLAALARVLTEATGHTISPGILSSWVNSTQENKQKMIDARKVGAVVLAEDSVNIIDELAGTEVTREEIQLARERSAARQWLASKHDRTTYGGDSAQVNVQVNLPGQHLEAMRRRAILAKTQQQLPAGPDVEIVSESGETV